MSPSARAMSSPRPLQLAMAYATVANGGVCYTPRLVQDGAQSATARPPWTTTATSPCPDQPKIRGDLRQVVKQSDIEVVRKGLWEVVNERRPGGGAPAPRAGSRAPSSPARPAPPSPASTARRKTSPGSAASPPTITPSTWSWPWSRAASTAAASPAPWPPTSSSRSLPWTRAPTHRPARSRSSPPTIPIPSTRSTPCPITRKTPRHSSPTATNRPPTTSPRRRPGNGRRRRRARYQGRCRCQRQRQGGHAKSGHAKGRAARNRTAAASSNAFSTLTHPTNKTSRQRRKAPALALLIPLKPWPHLTLQRPTRSSRANRSARIAFCVLI